MRVTNEHREAALWVESQWIRLHSWTMMAYLGVASVALLAANMPLGAPVPLVAMCLLGLVGGYYVAHLNVRRILTQPTDYARLYRALRRTRRQGRSLDDFREFHREIWTYVLRTHRRDGLGLVVSAFGTIGIAAVMGPLVATFMLLSFYSALNVTWFALKTKVLEPLLSPISEDAERGE